MNKKKITPALLSGMMTISVGTTPISVLAQEEQPQEINETNVEQVNEPVSTEETEITVNTDNDSQITSTEQQNEPEESSEINTANTKQIAPVSNTMVKTSSAEKTDSSVAMLEMNGTVTYYDDLNEAVHAISDVWGTGTITLLNNASLTGWSATEIYGNITLNGSNKYTVSGDYAGIHVAGTLTINNCNFSHAPLYSIIGGTINIHGGTFGNIHSIDGTINIYEGNFNTIDYGQNGTVNYIPNSITIEESTVSIQTGSEYQLNWRVDQNPIKVVGNNITISPAWTSSNPDIVYVDAQGYLTAKDIGTATITASAGGIKATCEVTVTKKTQEKPNLDSLTADYIDNDSMVLYCAEIASFNNLQYAYVEGDNATEPTNDDEWNEVPSDRYIRLNDLTEATPYTIFLRYKETNDSAASKPSHRVFTTMYSSAYATIDYANETIHVPEENTDYQVIFGNESPRTITSDEDGNIPIEKEWIGNTLNIQLFAAPGSMYQELAIPARPATPSLSGEVTGSGVNDCKITGLEDNIAYEIYSENEQTWKEATVVNGEITGLSVGTYQVRIKASSSSFASIPTIVTINKADSSINFKDGFSLDKTYDTKAVSVNADNVETTGSKGNISFFYEKKVGESWEPLSEAPTGAGTYRVTATLDGDNNYNIATSQPLEFTIGKADTVIEFTVENLNKVYDGKAAIAPTKQSGNSNVRVLRWYQINEDGTETPLSSAPINAGKYKVVATVEADDNFYGAGIEKTFEITKVVPSYTLPSGLVIKQGETLSSVVLPEGFTWKDGTQKADTLGTQTFKATYTPEDTTNYQTIDVDVTVDVVPATTPVNQPPVINAKDQTLTVGDKFDPMKGVTATDKEDGDLTDKIVITKNTVDTSKAGKYTIDYEVTDNGGTRVRKTVVVTVKEKATTSDEENKSDTDKKTPSKDTAQTSAQTNVLAWTLLGLASAGAFITGLFKRKHQ